MVVILADWRTIMHFFFAQGSDDLDKSEVYIVDGTDGFYIGILEHPMSIKDQLI